jgi:anti-sigma factor RsiW
VRGLDRCRAGAHRAGGDVVTNDLDVLGPRARARRPASENGLWFYLGALTATLGIGIVAAFVLGDAAADQTPGSPKTPVAIFDVVAGLS